MGPISRALMLAAGVFCAALPGKASAQPYPQATAFDFLVQSNCITNRGVIKPGVLPFSPSCGRRHGLRWFQGMAYRKHDWPAPEHRAGAPLGYQASDAYMAFSRGWPVAVQTFDYGTAPYTYGAWDQGADGGDAVYLRDNEASIGVSEDSDGIKWLHGAGCAPNRPLAPGWLSFQNGRGERVVPIAISFGMEGVNNCPPAFGQSLTRWRSRLLDFPYLMRGTPAGTFRTEFIISEHYSHPETGQSNAMERFWFARGLGKVRWEAWVNLDNPPSRDAAFWRAQAEWFASTQRCPEVGGGFGPNDPGRSNWVLTECRTWTNFEPSPPDRLIPILLWPALQALP